MAVRTISVALLQLAAHDRYDFSQAWPGVLEQVAAAASASANVIVLPEVTIPGYVVGFEQIDPEVISSAISDLQALADLHGCVIIAGTAERQAAGPQGLRNSAVVICPQAPPQYSSKRFLWHFDSLWFDPGIDLEPIDTPFGKIGIVVCADGRIPIIASTLVDRGAELLVIVTAWVTSGRDPEHLENIQADLLARVRAWENATPLVAANKSGCEYASVLYCGKSQAVTADGTMIATASQNRAETLTVSVDLDDARKPIRSAPLILARRSASSPTTRIAVSSRLTKQQYDVATWSGVEAIFCTESSVPIVESPRGAVLGSYRRPAVVALGELEVVVLPDDALRDPAYLTAARLAGYDFFIWYPQAIEPAWIIPLARTRALELRAYIVVFASDGRIAVIDPQGTVIAGTTADFRIPQFVYDPAQTAATVIVPNTDILAGLTDIEKLR